MCTGEYMEQARLWAKKPPPGDPLLAVLSAMNKNSARLLVRFLSKVQSLLSHSLCIFGSGQRIQRITGEACHCN
jgi:hypothetical protein